jgi:hypothetical protein
METMKKLSLLSGIIVKLKYSRRFGKRISAKQEMNAIEKCKGDWIFIIDSDEELKLRLKYLNE